MRRERGVADTVEATGGQAAERCSRQTDRAQAGGSRSGAGAQADYTALSPRHRQRRVADAAEPLGRGCAQHSCREGAGGQHGAPGETARAEAEDVEPAAEDRVAVKRDAERRDGRGRETEAAETSTRESSECDTGPQSAGWEQSARSQSAESGDTAEIGSGEAAEAPLDSQHCRDGGAEHSATGERHAVESQLTDVRAEAADPQLADRAETSDDREVLPTHRQRRVGDTVEPADDRTSQLNSGPPGGQKTDTSSSEEPARADAAGGDRRQALLDRVHRGVGDATPQLAGRELSPADLRRTQEQDDRRCRLHGCLWSVGCSGRV